MKSEINQQLFGSYLKSVRLERELEIHTLSRNTKITVHLIRAMEENAHDRLPPPPYVKGFIRTYAKAMGVDTETAVNLYVAELEQKDNTKQQALKRQAKLIALRRILTTVGVITGILLLVRFTDIFPDKAPLPTTTVSGITAWPELSTNDTNRITADTPKENLKLQVTAVEETWLKVLVDGKNARSYDLKPEDRLELEGTDNFNLMIGNATGLVIFLNGRPVQIYGSKGQIVSLKIP